MGALDDAINFLESASSRAKMYRGDMDLGSDVVYEPDGVMILQVGDLATGNQARFTPRGAEVRQDDSWSDASSDTSTLQLYRLLDPRSFKHLLSRAQEVPGSPSNFHLTYYLHEVFPELEKARETGVPFVYPRDTKEGTFPETVSEETREWISHLLEDQRDVHFVLSLDADAPRIIEMDQSDLDPSEGLYSLRFSYQ